MYGRNWAKDDGCGGVGRGRLGGAGLSVLVACAVWGVAAGAAAAEPERSAPAVVWPMPRWQTAAPAEVGMDAAKLAAAREYALTGGGSGYITRHGRLVMSWGDPRARYDLKSTTKSFGSIALGLALKDGRIRLEDRAVEHHPQLGIPPEENAQTGWLDEITILQLASQTAGFEKPGGYTRLLFQPGTRWDYSDSGPNWLAECLTRIYGCDLQEWMFERVFTPLGIGPEDLTWRKNAYRPATIDRVPRREFGAGIHANVDAMARIGYLMLREGQWQGREILTRDYVRRASCTPAGNERLPVHKPEDYDRRSPAHYGLLWWNNSDETLEGVPLDAYWSWGLYDSLIVVIPSLDLVVARAGKSWQRRPGSAHYDVLEPFLVPIVEAVGVGDRPDGSLSRSERITVDALSRSERITVDALSRSERTTVDGLSRSERITVDALSRSERSTVGALSRSERTTVGAAAASPLIAGIRWAPVASIVRQARGSDNWPLTWGDDDLLYTAYGDGRGFEPFVPSKLSLGLARLRGNPPDHTGENLRAATLEQTGDGARGKKASGLLMVDGVLYLWARNAGNSQLAWSEDHGATWQWPDWRWSVSFGCPTFLNFGRDYAGARDEWVYVYSHDSDSAYQRADRMVMARVPKDRLLQQSAYEFFHSLDREGKPVWTGQIEQRGAVFTNPGRCYRSGVSFNAGLQRYLWVHTGTGEDTRFAGGLAVYDAPEPWGPWTCTFATDSWDVGPGETASFPPKWMSDDGRQVHLVFSGDDCFSVRAATLELR